MHPQHLVIEAPELRLDPQEAIRGVVWSEIFGNDRPVEIEVGIGKGRFLLAAAAAQPQINWLGVEWSNQYLRIAELRAKKAGLKNLRFLRCDAREFVGQGIAENSVSQLYVFYPDPWPKKRHHKRRFFQISTLDRLARILVPGGAIHVATDHPSYWEAIEPLFRNHRAFEPLPEFGGERFPLPTQPPLTNYEAKFGAMGLKLYRASWRKKKKGDTILI